MGEYRARTENAIARAFKACYVARGFAMMDCNLEGTEEDLWAIMLELQRVQEGLLRENRPRQRFGTPGQVAIPSVDKRTAYTPLR